MAGSLDEYGFDLAVALTALRRERSPEKEKEKAPTQDPIAWFQRMGQDGWNKKA